MKKRILIFSMTYFPKPVGGAEVAIREITNRMGTEHYEWHLISLRFDRDVPKREQVDVVTVHRIGPSWPGVTSNDTFRTRFYPLKILYIPLAAMTAWRLHRQQRFDVFWSMMVYMTYPVALLRFCFGVRIPYVLTLQEGDTFAHVFNRWYIRPFRPLLVYGVRHASKVQAISNFLAGWATRMGFIGQPVVIPNAVNTTHFTSSFESSELQARRSEFGAAPNDMVLVTTSRLVYKNGIDTVIRALAKLPKHVRFVIYGSGPEEISLRELAAACGVIDRVYFGGHIEHAVMPQHLKACDIFIRPSRSEGMGNSFIEAMAAELPVIATQAGGIADFLFDERRDPDTPATGWAVDIDDADSIVEAVHDIMSRPAAVEAVVARAKAMATEHYDWDRIADRMEQEVFSANFKSL